MRSLQPFTASFLAAGALLLPSLSAFAAPPQTNPNQPASQADLEKHVVIVGVSDDSPPNEGENLIHWDNLWGVPFGLLEAIVAEGLIATALDCRRCVTSEHVDQLQSSNIENESLLGLDIQDDSLTGDDIDESTLVGVGPYGASVPSGATITGAWVLTILKASITTTDVIFPFPAPESLTGNIGFEAEDHFTRYALDTERDPECTGTVDAPTAPPGKVCIYEDGKSFSPDQPILRRQSFGTGHLSRWGFRIRNIGIGAGSFDPTFLGGTWAYTAP